MHQFNQDEVLLNVGQYKTIYPFRLNLDFKEHQNDPFAHLGLGQPEFDANDYCNGVHIVGEMSIDGPRHYKSQAVHEGVQAEVTLFRDYLKTKFKILVVEHLDEQRLDREKDYYRNYWLVYGVSKPIEDQLELFSPPRGTLMRVFVCTNFLGEFWPEKVSTVVIAPDINRGKVILKEKLKENGIDTDDFSLKEIDTTTESVAILNLGTY